MDHRNGITQYTSFYLRLGSFVECNYFTIYQYLSYGLYCCDKHEQKLLGGGKGLFWLHFTIIIHH